jgi:hypothetical protein
MLEFRSVFQGVLTTVEALSEEFLAQKRPFDWPADPPSLGEMVASNTFEHYQEHGEAIKRWLGNR